ncbi:MAG TPA: hypothetical protein VHL11_02280, partial [Phototrophicaceae bacterium]|nr:hypothetical protein [Phototrophicaceae bacterium]
MFMYRFLPFALLLALPLFSRSPELLQTPPPVTPAYVCPGDSGQIAYTTSELSLLDVVTGRVDTLVSGPDGIFYVDGASWSPDGTHLAFATDYSGSWGIYAVDVDQSGKVEADLYPLFDDPDLDELNVVWSPDGQHLVFNAGENIYIGDVDSGTTIDLGTNLYSYNWLPDGSALIYVKPTDTETNQSMLYRADPVTGEAAEIVGFEGTPTLMSISVNGIVLLINYDEANIAHIMAVDLATGEINDLGLTEVIWGGWWSPDGQQILFITEGDDNNLVVTDSDGANPVILTEDLVGSIAGSAVWSPDGSRISFTAYGDNYEQSSVV